MLTHGFAAWVGATLGACAAAEAPRPIPTKPPASASKAEAPPPGLVQRDVPGRPRLTPLTEEPVEAARIALRAPREDAVLGASSAGEVTVDVDAGDWLARDARHRIALVLDDHRVRYVAGDSRRYRLADLVTAGMELAPGSHRLTAIAVSANGELLKPTSGKPQPFASNRFWIGEPPKAATASGLAELVYVEPQGTYNGVAAAAAARLDYYLLAREPTTAVDVIIRWSGGTMEKRLTEWHAWSLSDLLDGDYEVELRLVSADKSHRPAVRSAFSVNLDAPVPKNPSPPSSSTVLVPATSR